MRRGPGMLALVLGLLASAAGAGCNGTPAPCRVETGTYHLTLPPGATGPVRAVMMLHGHGGEGQGTIRNTGMVDVLLGRGYAVIAPDGQPRGAGRGRSWDFHPDRPADRDETAFLLSVAADASARHGIARDRILLAGFSIGGSLTSYVACNTPDAFAAYAPLAGSFWRPHPDRCKAPVRLLHTHGTADRTVPMTGREIRPGFRQGNVYEAMALWRATLGCPDAPDHETTVGPFAYQDWQGCAPGARLGFAVHKGGHSIPRGWVQLTLDWFEEG